MSLIKEGTKVRITDAGHTYSTYKGMFKKLGFHNQEVNNSNDVDLTQEFVVFNIGFHPEQGINVYAIQNQFGQQLLMSEVGLELILPMNIQQLCITYPNDQDLGAAVRLLNRE